LTESVEVEGEVSDYSQGNKQPGKIYGHTPAALKDPIKSAKTRAAKYSGK